VEGRFGAVQLFRSSRLLERVFLLDLGYCRNCGRELKIIAAMLEALVIEKILTNLGLQAAGPARGQTLHIARAPSRTPPTQRHSTSGCGNRRRPIFLGRDKGALLPG
jgi:hypothetical protein